MTKFLSKRARAKIPKFTWMIIDKHGVAEGGYDSREAAEEDACGPRFKPHEIRAYKLVPKSQEPK